MIPAMKTKLVCLVLGIALLGCGERGDDGTRGPEGAPLYVDVRTAEEFGAGHVEGALNIPHDQMQMRYRELEQYRNRHIIVYCRSGRRSEVALAVLREQGFPFLENGGGLDSLVAAGVKATK